MQQPTKQELRERIALLERRITELDKIIVDNSKWIDQVQNLYLCHQCQPELEACGVDE